MLIYLSNYWLYYKSDLNYVANFRKSIREIKLRRRIKYLNIKIVIKEFFEWIIPIVVNFKPIERIIVWNKFE